MDASEGPKKHAAWAGLGKRPTASRSCGAHPAALASCLLPGPCNVTDSTVYHAFGGSLCSVQIGQKVSHVHACQPLGHSGLAQLPAKQRELGACCKLRGSHCSKILQLEWPMRSHVCCPAAAAAACCCPAAAGAAGCAGATVTGLRAGISCDSYCWINCAAFGLFSMRAVSCRTAGREQRPPIRCCPQRASVGGGLPAATERESLRCQPRAENGKMNCTWR